MSDKTRRAGQPLVSVALITYNHRAFIREAIDSVLMQEYGGNIEIIVADDCSTDGTTEIVREYVARNPGKIRHLLAEKNKGAHQNVQDALASCTGKYTALLEGDDYWTDKSKIAEQVRILEFDKEASAVGHQVTVIGTRHGDFGPNASEWPENPKARITLADALACHIVPTASVVFRTDSLPEYPQWARGLAMGDWPLILTLAEHGHINLMPKCMAVYRLHEGGSWSRANAISRIRSTRELFRALHSRYGKVHGNLIAKALYDSSVAGLRHLDSCKSASRGEIGKELEKTILCCARMGHWVALAECKLWVRLRFPIVYSLWASVKAPAK